MLPLDGALKDTLLGLVDSLAFFEVFKATLFQWFCVEFADLELAQC